MLCRDLFDTARLPAFPTSKRTTMHMKDEETIITAFEQFFRSERQTIRWCDAKRMLESADVPKVLAVMESAAERHKREPLRSPVGFIFSRLNKLRPTDVPLSDLHSGVIRFDSDGNRCRA